MSNTTNNNITSVLKESRLFPPAAEFSKQLKQRGVLMNGISETHVRAVTHCDVSEQACRDAATAVEEVAAK